MRVNPDRQRVVKLFPSNPPHRGEVLIVDDVRRRVTWARVKWNGPRWTIRSLRVRAA